MAATSCNHYGPNLLMRKKHSAIASKSSSRRGDPKNVQSKPRLSTPIYGRSRCTAKRRLTSRWHPPPQIDNDYPLARF